MREGIRGDPGEQSSGRRLSALLAFAQASWKIYGKLALGLLLVAMLVVFVIQNVDSIRVRFLAWEVNMSQALVVFLAALAGVIFGVVFSRWQQWRA